MLSPFDKMNSKTLLLIIVSLANSITSLNTQNLPNTQVTQNNQNQDNHVFYAANDYYFSSSEKLPDKNKASNAWW